jgi:hypothetical protein
LAREFFKFVGPVPAIYPLAYRRRIGGAGGFQEIFGALFVLIEIGARREWEGVVRVGQHAKLLSMRLESALEQAERRFVAFEIVNQGGHGPFRGLEAPFALRGEDREFCELASIKKIKTF